MMHASNSFKLLSPHINYYIVHVCIVSLCISCLQGRTNLPPEKVPWDAIKTLLSECIYGGKIDNDFDQVKIFHLLLMSIFFKHLRNYWSDENNILY